MSFNYTAFGEQVKLTGADNEGTKEGISYTGHFFDKESKLYYARARYLDPATGRFITQDPLQDPSRRYGPSGLNRYIYGLNNPLKFWDPMGENDWDNFWNGVGNALKGVGDALSKIDWGKVLEVAALATVVTLCIIGSVFTMGTSAILGMALLGAAVGTVAGAVNASAHNEDILGGGLQGGVIGFAAGAAGAFAGGAAAGALGLTAGTTGAGIVTGMVGGAVSGAINGFGNNLQTGLYLVRQGKISVDQMWAMAGQGAVTGMVTGMIGGMAGGVTGAVSGIEDNALRLGAGALAGGLAGGLVGGIGSAISGGDFFKGFEAGAVSGAIAACLEQCQPVLIWANLAQLYMVARREC